MIFERISLTPRGLDRAGTKIEKKKPMDLYLGLEGIIVFTPIDIWLWILCATAECCLFFSLFLFSSISISYFPNVYPCTQCVGLLYLRTNRQIYRYYIPSVLRVCLVISHYILPVVYLWRLLKLANRFLSLFLFFFLYFDVFVVYLCIYDSTIVVLRAVKIVLKNNK